MSRPLNKGKVRSFNEKAGYGFIIEDETNRLVFIHHINIVGEGYKTLNYNEEVEFDLYERAPNRYEAFGLVRKT